MNDCDNLLAIAARYHEEILRFVSGNPELQSRFTCFIDFPDYSVAKQAHICRHLAEEQNYALTLNGRLLVDASYCAGVFVKVLDPCNLQQSMHQERSQFHDKLNRLGLIVDTQTQPAGVYTRCS